MSTQTCSNHRALLVWFSAACIGLSFGLFQLLAHNKMKMVPNTPSAVKHARGGLNPMAIMVPVPQGTPSVATAQREILATPVSINAHLHLGLAYYDHERYSDAIALFTNALKRWPNVPQFRYWLACSYMGNGSLSDAIRAFEWLTTHELTHNSYLAHHTRLGQLYCIRSYALMGRCYYELHDDRNAEIASRKALEIDNNEPCAKQTIAKLHNLRLNLTEGHKN